MADGSVDMVTANLLDVLIKAVQKHVTNPVLLYLCKRVITDKQFTTAPGGSSKHHAYARGLLEHTAEVMSHVLRMANPGLNMEVLVASALFHDYWKIYEYEAPDDEGKVATTPFRNLIGHLTGSVLWFWDNSSGMPGISRDMRIQIAHCMLAHHGRREWGSPVEPTTAEAYLLHAADMLSSRQR